ncbi:uncharacterized protein [Palaemon carinicauda]|uniref:uncharacterized protein isoform X2 n=1 Tax=Palaemon carinicauda TaxID=392227 RepID=UPI0035B5F439
MLYSMRKRLCSARSPCLVSVCLLCIILSVILAVDNNWIPAVVFAIFAMMFEYASRAAAPSSTNRNRIAEPSRTHFVHDGIITIERNQLNSYSLQELNAAMLLVTSHRLEIDDPPPPYQSIEQTQDISTHENPKSLEQGEIGTERDIIAEDNANGLPSYEAALATQSTTEISNQTV